MKILITIGYLALVSGLVYFGRKTFINAKIELHLKNKEGKSNAEAREYEMSIVARKKNLKYTLICLVLIYLVIFSRIFV